MTDRPPPPIKKPGSKPQSARAYTDAIAMQTVMLAIVNDSSQKPNVRAGCVRAWCDLEERKRILRMKPMPGQLRPDLMPKKPKVRRTPVPQVAQLEPAQTETITPQTEPETGIMLQ